MLLNLQKIYCDHFKILGFATDEFIVQKATNPSSTNPLADGIFFFYYGFALSCLYHDNLPTNTNSIAHLFNMALYNGQYVTIVLKPTM